MLLRSAGRRQRRHSTAQLLASSFAQLNLPWLAPAQLRWSASQAAATATTTTTTTHQPDNRIRKRSLSKRHANRSPTRSLATAATSEYRPSYHDPSYGTPFADTSKPDQTTPSSSSSLTRRSLGDVLPYEDPIIINNSTLAPEPMVKIVKGIPGTTTELLQYLRASLQVGRHQGAVTMLKRLADTRPASSPELRYAHSAYMQSMLRELISQGRGTMADAKMQEMSDWFHREIKAKGVTVDAKMLVALVRGCIRSMDGSIRIVKVREYAQMAKEFGDEVYDEVLFSEDYDDNEFTFLGAITSDFYEQHLEDDYQAATDEASEEVSKLRSALEQYRRHDYLPTEQLPDIRSTQLVGSGLEGVKRSTQPLFDRPSLDADAPLEDQRRVAHERQVLLEETAVDVAIDQWRKADEDLRRMGISTSLQSRPISALMWQWFEALVPTLEKELEECRKLNAMTTPKSPAEEDRQVYGPFLETLNLQKVAASTILFTMTSIVGSKRNKVQSEPHAKLAQLATGLASQIESETIIEAAKSKNPRRARRVDYMSPHRVRQMLAKQLRTYQDEQKSEESRAPSDTAAPPAVGLGPWSDVVKVKLGAMLLEKLLDAAQLPVTRTHPRTLAKITGMQSAFLHKMAFISGKRVGIVAPNPALVEKLDHEPVSSFISKRLPMIVEPKPWTSYAEGAYLRFSDEIMRLADHDRSSKEYLEAAHSRKDMQQVYAGLTALGKVPWKIHHGVFQVQLEAWNSGDAIANFAPANPTFDLPPEPEPSDDPEPRRHWLREVRELENKRTGLHSQRCFQNFQLEIAKAMVNETMYFPHNMDFRGRAYPIPPYLNHMGADNVRGLLVFADGKELGPDGLRWLKIHLATVAGHDKASLEERVQFTEDNINNIYDSARDPLGGKRWWLEAEDAWQTLAACFELVTALDSPDPEKFVSHVPIQQDGTCNGLQHYAALGGDKVGAAQVNLEPSDRPADVYTAVLQAVVDEVHKDAEAGLPVARKLDGHITRKCVKQPVMTNVYGVTWYGAKEQVQRQLEAIFPHARQSDEVTVGAMSQYVATKIFKSLGHMFAGAQAIQHWLGQCADRITTCLTPEQIALFLQQSQPSPPPSVKAAEKVEEAESGEKPGKKKRGPKSKKATEAKPETPAEATKPVELPQFKSTVIWTTPLRLPVVQPYRQPARRVIKTNLQRIDLQEPQVWHPVSKRKQLQAFPPNFIHSLDATHMLLSALKCNEVDITFASIHDSFWCHAADVNRMGILLRDAFISMHKENVVGRLREEFQIRYKDCLYQASVPYGSDAGRAIAAWRRSHARRAGKGSQESAELRLEVERLRLLKSEFAAERERGEAMITPASLLAAAGGGGEGDAGVDPAGDSGLSEKALGSIPEAEAAALEADSASASEADESVADEDPLSQQQQQQQEEEEEGIPANACPAPAADADAAADAAADPLEKPPSMKKTKKAAGSSTRKLHVWLPLSFPPVPAKGGFDVTRLSESRYFFH